MLPWKLAEIKRVLFCHISSHFFNGFNFGFSFSLVFNDCDQCLVLLCLTSVCVCVCVHACVRACVRV